MTAPVVVWRNEIDIIGCRTITRAARAACAGATMAFSSDNDTVFSPNTRRLWASMSPCTLCPRNCRVNRHDGETGFCGIADMPLVSSVGPHFGEESVLVGCGGSGTIFFAGCNLGCVFCQNYDISHQRHGRKMSVEQLVTAMLDLQQYGCVNINFVTPTHVAPAMAAAIESARRRGLVVPTVYNSGGYDSVQTLRLLKGLVDIYMPDMKYSDNSVADELSDAPDYPQLNRLAVREMHRQAGDLVIDKGPAACGLLVRHLVLPNNQAGSFEIIDFLAQEVSPKTAINVMGQYHPCYKASEHRFISRCPTPEEIQDVRDYALGKGLILID